MNNGISQIEIISGNVDIILSHFQDGKDLTSKFIEFAEEYLTNKKGDPQHNPTVSSCLVRVPGTVRLVH